MVPSMLPVCIRMYEHAYKGPPKPEAYNGDWLGPLGQSCCSWMPALAASHAGDMRTAKTPKKMILRVGAFQ